MRLVLDTNIWVDWLLFDDPSVAALKTARQEGQIQIVIDEACLGELNAVLAYPEFGLEESQKHSHLAEVDRCTTLHDGRKAAPAFALPRCRDPDDQKFLMLARDSKADWLLTRDKALLRLSRRLHSVGIRIGSPSEWSIAFTSSH